MMVCSTDIDTFLEACPACDGVGDYEALFGGIRRECLYCEGWGRVHDADATEEAMGADWDAHQEALAAAAY
jgi:hypothetical protein